jgi:hypothetical protein
VSSLRIVFVLGAGHGGDEKTTCSYHLEEAFRMVSAAVRFDPSTEPNYSYDFTAATDAAQPSADDDPDRPEGTPTHPLIHHACVVCVVCVVCV